MSLSAGHVSILSRLVAALGNRTKLFEPFSGRSESCDVGEGEAGLSLLEGIPWLCQPQKALWGGTQNGWSHKGASWLRAVLTNHAP